MADPGSTLSPLKTKVEELGVLDQIAHLGKQFTKEEKKEYFNSLPDKKYKVGLIRNKELDTVIKIFTESFDFSKKISLVLSKANTFVSKECRGVTEFEENDGDNGESVDTGRRIEENDDNGENEENKEDEGEGEGAAAQTGGDGEPIGAAPAEDDKEEKPAIAAPAEVTPPEYNNGFNREGNLEEKELIVPPETIGTSSDFERLYLGWMNDPAEALSEEDKQKRKNSMKSLFRFIFGKKNISDVTATTFQKKLRLAYTPLETEEKLPCAEGGAWTDFRKSLVYRRKLAMCELFAARDVLGDERRLYIDRKKALALGLRDLIDVLDRNVYPCMIYAYDSSQHEEDVEVMNDEEFSRILTVFRTFVKDRKEGRPHYSLNTLKKELSKKDKAKETATALYDELLALLTWMAGEAEAAQRISGLQQQIEQLQEVATEQKQDISELENLVLLLSVLLAMSEKIHKLRLALAELKCQIEKCCDKKRAAKLARSASVKEADIQTLEKEIQSTSTEYEILVKKLQKTIDTQTNEIQELEELVLALSQVLISIDKIHTLRMSLDELRKKLEECCEKKKKVEGLSAQLEALNNVLARKNQSTQTVAAQAMVNQGVQFANTANSELEKQIAELRQRIKTLMEEDARKGKRIENLEAESASKDVVIRELEEVTDALMAVIIGIKDMHDIERNLASLRQALEICCERKKTARECKEKLDLLEARIRELMEKEGKTKELEASLKGCEENRQKAVEAEAALKGQIETLRTQLEEVLADSKDDLESVVTELRNEENKDSTHAAELAARIAELEAQVLGAEKALAEAKDSHSASLKIAQNTAAAEKAAKNQLQKNLNAARASAAGYEKELADAAAAREAAAAAARAHQEATDAAKKAADAEVARLKKELDDLTKGAMNLAGDLQDQLDAEIAKGAVKEAEAAARIAAAEAAVAAALAQVAEAEEDRARIAGNRNKLAANVKVAQAAAAAAEAARATIEGERARAEHGLQAALIELGTTRDNRNAARAAIGALQEQINRQHGEDERALAAAHAAVAAAQAEAETAVGASQAERDAIAAQLAQRVAELGRLQGDQAAQAAEVAALQAANAALAAQLAAITQSAREAAAAAKAKGEENAAGAAKAEQAAREAAEKALAAHQKRIDEIVAASKAELERVEAAAREASKKAEQDAKANADRRVAEAEAAAAKATGNARAAAQKEVEAAKAAAAAAQANAAAARVDATGRIAEAEAAAEAAREAAKKASGEERAAAEKHVREAEAAAQAAIDAVKANAERRVAEAKVEAAKASGEARAAAEERVREAVAAADAAAAAAAAGAKADADRQVAAARAAAEKATGEARADAEKRVREAEAAAEAATAAASAAAERLSGAEAAVNAAGRRSAAQQIELDELARKSAALAAELEAARTAAGTAGAAAGAAANEIGRLRGRIAMLEGEGLDKTRLISHLEEQLHEARARAPGKATSVFNRLYPGKPLAAPSAASPPREDARPPFRVSAGPGQYTGRAAMGVSGASPGSTGAAGVGPRTKFGGGGKPKKSFCEVMLTLLLLELSQHEDVNPEVFLKKAGTTLDELGQCPLVLRALSEIVDESIGQNVPEDGYLYSPTNVTNTAFAERLEAAYESNFTQAEKDALLHSAPPILYFSKSPEEFEGILGNRPYFLNGARADAGKQVRLRGVDLDDDEEPVMMTGEERELVEKGGVPLGAIIFLYLSCLKDHEEEEGEEVALALRSKAFNDSAN
jgi:hypothetical protein